MSYDVLIIGAGAAGYGAALTLASANDKFDWAKDKKYLILDSNKSDLNAGRYINVAGIEAINGVDLIKNLKNQLKIYPACTQKDESNQEVERKETPHVRALKQLTLAQYDEFLLEEKSSIVYFGWIDRCGDSLNFQENYLEQLLIDQLVSVLHLRK